MIIRFWVQFEINLHEWVFQKVKIARAASANAIPTFWKTHKCKLISNWTRKTVLLLINNIKMKNFVWRKCRKIFFEDIHFFFIWENSFQIFHTKFSSSFYVISLASKTSCCLSANHNPELRFGICTGVTLFALALHLNCTACSQSESSNFFTYIYYY